MTGFADALKKLTDKTKGDLEKAARQAMFLGAQGVVMQSPVGNPELWAANAHAMYGRQTHNLWVEAINADLKGKKGRLRKLGQKKLKETYKLAAGKGYVGGRFRANWQFGVGSADTTTTEGTDANGNATLARLKGAIDGAKIGGTWIVSNSLPYAKRLEYGWSKQAPAGMVRLTAQELPDAIRAYVRGEL